MQNKEKKKSILDEFLYFFGMALMAIFIVAISLFAYGDIGASLKKFFSLFIGEILIVFMLLIFLYIYQMYIIKGSRRICSKLVEYLIVNSIVVLGIVVSELLFVFYSPYAMAIAYVSLFISIILHQRLGLMAAVISFMMLIIVCPVSYSITGAMPINVGDYFGLIVSMLVAIVMVFLVHNGYTRLKLTWGAITLSLISVPIAYIFCKMQSWNTKVDVFNSVLASFLGNLIAVGLVTVLLPIYETQSRVWTDFKLSEISSANSKLLKRLREEAPGTFNHSLTVANMAESCAIAIGLNPFMARTCAMYHDIGKISNPQFFVENQIDGYNPHDELIIDASVKIITGHTKESAKILKEAKMPDTVIKAALEHHGTSTLMYFYLKAKVLTDGELDSDKYRYEGPKPTTKYSAIVMLCDVSEAITRSANPENQEELENIVFKVIQDRVLDGQFTDCDISLQDLHKIGETICKVIPAMLHKRIDYNKAKERR